MSGPLLLGVRHHGPGSARAVRTALEAHAPAEVLVEGPAEADAVVRLAAEDAMRPPVALLAHVVDEPARAAFWPLAAFSPEWVAIRWALARDVPVRFFDLPAAHTLALPAEPAGPDSGGDGPSLRLDPLATLAAAAGHDDPERWWEDVVEHRGRSATGESDPLAPFTALAGAMAELRAAHGDGGRPRDLIREAHMRLRLREARRRQGDDAVAVVCGAWHVPALAAPAKVTDDRRLLRGLPRARVDVTWVPWTDRRLAHRSGYGAGVDSPGWYGHLFAAPDRPVERWMTRAARLLREEDMPVSPAEVIEAVRLADTLAALRDRPLAGLTETLDAVRAVLCGGSDVPLELVRERLVVGEALGEVPAGAPVVPLQRDLARQQRSLRLRAEGADRELALDLRRDVDVARSRLLHRLRLLGVPWGEPVGARSAGTGTFRESWLLRWEPELAVRVAEAGIWGTTVLSAATAKARRRAAETGDLAGLTTLAEQCLPAELPEALPAVMRALADRAALDTDVGHLAQALPPLVRSVRYGDVRGSDAAAPARVAAGLAERVRIGLPPACAGLDADGAAQLRRHLDTAHRAVVLLARGEPGEQGSGASGGELLSRWYGMLRDVVGRDRVPGLLRGRSARLLLDDGRLPEEEAAGLLRLALSPGTPPAEAAAWIEGFLSGSGLLLVHDTRLFALVDAWLTGVGEDVFTEVLPLLRRTFAPYEAGVRRTLGELVRRGPAPGGTGTEGLPGFAPDLDARRADAVLPTVRRLLAPGPAGTSARGPGGSRTAATASRRDAS
ncbi:DUF5682 family protein [Streptomyces sp. TR02-1]|uniref:DUF5682 family protein n=1 Tax=Streptomyces sp. TR02-1 TaxID=3385977 RepID=UPI00399FC555